VKVGMLMTKSLVFLIFFTVFAVGFSLIFGIIIFFKKRRINKLKAELSSVERDKNMVVSSRLLTELNKAESLANNDALKQKLATWNETFDTINSKDIPHITDEILHIEELIEEKKYDDAEKLMPSLEIVTYYAKAKSMFLLFEVRSLTTSEERNREAVTKLKTLYRQIVLKYNNNIDDYKEIKKAIELQFENIDKLFSAFEKSMDNNNFEETPKIVKALSDLIKNLEIVIEESPTILFMGRVIIPKKISEIKSYERKLTKTGYNLEYMNLDYNIEQSNKKVNLILDKLKVLNLEDSIFDLKTILDYYDSIIVDFDKEKNCKAEFEEEAWVITEKISRISKMIKNIYMELSEIKDSYDLSSDVSEGVNQLNSEFMKLKEEFREASDRSKIKVIPYSKMHKDIQLVHIRINALEDGIEKTIRELSSLKEDEYRAREQLIEINEILRNSKLKIKEYKLPILPKNYTVELKEAKEAINEIVNELEKRPISIKTLNTRVDTARDLVFKLYNTARELVKTAAMCELAIVYGNRYRTSYKEVRAGLLLAEKEFYKGEYRKGLETVLGVLNIVEPGINKKLLSVYSD
jgi:septation ring formation regulator